jgi:hypothetical protein
MDLTKDGSDTVAYHPGIFDNFELFAIATAEADDCGL